MMIFGGLVMLALWILGLMVNIGGGIYMFFYIGLVMLVIGIMKAARKHAFDAAPRAH